jgi:eukaryotic-like serine/threonine-protein kinase
VSELTSHHSNLGIRHPLDLLEPDRLQQSVLLKSLSAVHGHASLPAGHRFGAFSIQRELGRGGMGTVYLAERVDGELNQHVAIKCVPRAGFEQRALLFRQERQRLSELEHPNIARLLEVGSDGDWLWFAMEYIDGLAFDRFLTNAQADKNTDRTSRMRIALLLQLIDATNAAHQRLLIHRDIKPANVMVDQAGTLKLLDFGIASFESETQQTAAYSPSFASPEQLQQGMITPASDQYQIGRLLALALHDCTPVGRRGAELREIVKKATNEDPTLRYSSVAALGDDLRAWLAQKPVAAFGGGLNYMLRCAVRRNPLTSIASFAGVFAFLGTIGFFSARLAAERDYARAEAQRATIAADTANSISRFLQDDVFAFADPNTSQDAELKVAALLSRAETSVGSRLANRPAMAAELLITIARSQRGLGELSAAEKTFAQASELLARVADPQLQLQWHLWHGELLSAQSKLDDAITDLSKARDLAKPLGAMHPLYLEAQVRLALAQFERSQSADTVDALSKLVAPVEQALGTDAPLSIFLLSRLSIALNTVERVDEAERIRREQLQRAERVYGQAHSTTLTARLNLAVLLRKLRRLDEAATEAAAASAGIQKIFGHPSVASLHAQNVRSNILRDAGKLDQAIALQQDTLAARIKLLGEVHDDVAFSYANLAGSLMAAKRYREANAELQRALAIRTQLYAADHVEIVSNLSLLAEVERLNGNMIGAERYAEDAVARADRGLAADRLERGSTWFRYSVILDALGKREAAHDAAAKARIILIKHLPATHPRIQTLDAILNRSN